MSDTAAGRPARVHVERLKLTGFRNYDAADIALRPGLVVLTGENGAGKTNLLEAVSLLSPGRGLRRAAYGEMERQRGQGGFAIHATIDGDEGACSIGTGTAFAEGEAAGRKVRINGAAASAEEMMERLRVAWLTPAMDALFTGTAGERRRYLDRLVLTIDPGHARRALDYEKAMRGRNRLLAEDRRDDRWLSAIEAQMAETGVAIAAARRETVGLMARLIATTDGDAVFPRALVALEGELEAAVGETAAVDVEASFIRDLATGRGRDAAAGRTLVGPHRSDLLVRHEPKDMPAQYCSTGEQKALLVGMTLAHARLTAEVAGMVPILLLDEIAAHLDPGRRAALFAILSSIGGQVLMTGTDVALFASVGDSAQFLTVAHGAVASS